LIAGLMMVGFGPLAVQVMNAALTAVTIVLVAAWAESFSREVGILVALLAAASPLMLERMIWPMTEALAICSRRATVLAMRIAERPTVRC
jgi:mannose/cellobiose epimerase-like protein (N-acyl-D-glucosamine 2-epimerase family)